MSTDQQTECPTCRRTTWESALVPTERGRVCNKCAATAEQLERIRRATFTRPGRGGIAR